MCDDSRDDFQQLLRDVQAGSDEAARELYDKYVAHVLRCVRHRLWHKLRTLYDSQDFAQQVWASFFCARRDLPDFQTPEDLTRYLMAMAANKVKMAGRQKHTLKRDITLETLIQEQSDQAGLHPASHDPTPSAVATFHEHFHLLTDQQPPVAREIAQLRLEGNTFHEIAAELDLHEATVRRLLRQVRREAPPAPEEN